MFRPDLFTSSGFCYSTVLADPPWKFSAGGDRAASMHYDVMPLLDIKSLPVSSICAPDAALFLWATSPLLPSALEVVDAWGFTYKSCLTWVKLSKTGSYLHMGTGYWVRSSHEFLIFATRGSPSCVFKGQRSVFSAPVRGHSRKPDCVYDVVEAMRPQGGYVELFARQSIRPGWDSWGNEARKFGSALQGDHVLRPLSRLVCKR